MYSRNFKSSFFFYLHFKTNHCLWKNSQRLGKLRILLFLEVYRYFTLMFMVIFEVLIDHQNVDNNFLLIFHFSPLITYLFNSSNRQVRSNLLRCYPTTVVWGLLHTFLSFFPRRFGLNSFLIIHWVPSMVSFSSYLTYCSCICRGREGNPDAYI